MNPRNILALFCLAAMLSASAIAADQASAAKLPVTTTSPAAARAFESGMVEYENHRWNLALSDWNKAIKLDPKFAQAYVWICFTTNDPA